MMWMDAAIKAGMAGAVGYVTYKLIEEYGPGIADLLIDLHTNPEVERQPDEAAGHVPIRPAPILPPTGSNSIADDILERNPTLNRLDVEAIVLECRDLAVRAGLVAIDSAGGSYHPCRNLPIFVPGSDLGEVAEHKQRAIHRMPWSFQLTNATRSEMNDQLVAQGYSLALWSPWYTRVPADPPT